MLYARPFFFIIMRALFSFLGEKLKQVRKSKSPVAGTCKRMHKILSCIPYKAVLIVLYEEYKTTGLSVYNCLLHLSERLNFVVKL